MISGLGWFEWWKKWRSKILLDCPLSIFEFGFDFSVIFELLWNSSDSKTLVSGLWLILKEQSGELLLWVNTCILKKKELEWGEGGFKSLYFFILRCHVHRGVIFLEFYDEEMETNWHPNRPWGMPIKEDKTKEPEFELHSKL